MINVDKESLTKVISKEINYDGNIIESKIVCQKCKHVVREEVMSYWLDHRSILLSCIAEHIGIGEGKIKEVIRIVLDDFNPSGNKDIDAMVLCEFICSEIGV